MLGLAIVLGIWIGQDNSATTSFVLFGFTLGEMPLAFWVLVAFALGLMFGVLATLLPWLSAQQQVGRYRKRLLDVERKLARAELQRHQS